MLSDLKIIILLGAPGSGKGTQGNLLAEKLGFYYLETSKILEEKFHEQSEKDYLEIDHEKFFIAKEKELWQKGILCSPAFVSYLMEDKIKKLHEERKSLILSGSPRTMPEGEKIIPLLKSLYGEENIKIILIEITPEQTLFRNSNRKICELMRHSILYNEETKNLKYCPLDGSKLVKREGLDDPQTIVIRIREYKERTQPLLEYFRQQRLEVEKVKGEQSVADVYGEILEKIK